MTQAPLVEVHTFLYGLGHERQARPALVPLSAKTVPARDLIAAHVRAEAIRAASSRSESLALHYILADDVRAPALAGEMLDPEAEVARAWEGFTSRRFLLSVDGEAVADLDAPLTLSERSLVCFVRLIPLVGG
jgi:hypothetical protein